jgi:hypothetical protein
MYPKILSLALFLQVQFSAYALQSKTDKIARDIEHNTKVVSKKLLRTWSMLPKRAEKT